MPAETLGYLALPDRREEETGYEREPVIRSNLLLRPALAETP
jgi:hypothetical protein